MAGDAFAVRLLGCGRVLLLGADASGEAKRSEARNEKRALHA